MLQKSWDSGILTLLQCEKEEELRASVQYCMGHLSSEMGLSCHFCVPLAFHPSPWCDLPSPKPKTTASVAFSWLSLPRGHND